MAMITSDSAIGELIAIDYKHFTGDSDNIDRTRDLGNWYTKHGGTYKEGNMDGGLNKPTEEALTQAMLGQRYCRCS